jgi:hypothetical protein
MPFVGARPGDTLIRLGSAHQRNRILVYKHMDPANSGTLSSPGFKRLPDRQFSAEFLRARNGLFELIESYYDRDHLIRAADWIVALEPEAPEYLILAALSHDLERAIPGGPKLDMATTPWDDRAYNREHCERSAMLVPPLLARYGASDETLEALRELIREHEFGGSAEGDLMQAADSLSFLEVNGRLCASWVLRGACTRQKGLQKLHWMCARVRLERAKPLTRTQHRIALADFERELTFAAMVQAVPR